MEQKVCEVSARADGKFRQRGQLPPRERVNRLLDRDLPFLELSSLCGLGMHEDDGVDNVFGGGSIVGMGWKSGARSMIAASDSGIRRRRIAHPIRVSRRRFMPRRSRSRTSYPTSSSSRARAQIFCCRQFVRGGATFANMARLSAADPGCVDCARLSTAGGAYQTVQATTSSWSGRSKVFPPARRFAEGRDRRDRRGRATRRRELHCVTTASANISRKATSTYAAYRLDSSESAGARNRLPARAGSPCTTLKSCCGIAPVDYRKFYDAAKSSAWLVDGSNSWDFRFDRRGRRSADTRRSRAGRSASSATTDLIDLAVRARLASSSSSFCCQAGVPIVFLQNTTGYLVGVEVE